MNVLPLHDEARRSRRTMRWLVAGLTGVLASGIACSAPLSTRVTDSALTLEMPEPLSEPSVRTSDVTTDEDGITLWVRFRDVDGAHTVRVRWFDPLGRLALDSGPLVLNAEGGYRRIAGLTAYMPIRHAPSSMLPGPWRAEVSLDGRPLAEERFELARSERGRSTLKGPG